MPEYLGESLAAAKVEVNSCPSPNTRWTCTAAAGWLAEGDSLWNSILHGPSISDPSHTHFIERFIKWKNTSQAGKPIAAIQSWHAWRCKNKTSASRALRIDNRSRANSQWIYTRQGQCSRSFIHSFPLSYRHTQPQTLPRRYCTSS